MAERAKVKKLTIEDIEVGDWIEITKGRAGKVVWKGDVEFKTKTGETASLGLELVGSVGKHDGMWNGKRYFTCEEGRGMIVQMDRVRRRIKNPLKSGPRGKSSSKDLSKIGLSKKTLGVQEEEDSDGYEEAPEFTGWGSWDASEVCSYINKRLNNHGELFADAGYTGAKLVADFRGNVSACKDFFKKHDLNPVIGKSLNRYLKNDLTDDIRQED